MLVSLAWLRSLCPVGSDPAEIARALTDRGLTVDGLSTAGSDTVFDVDVPANRGDCLGHFGIARELGAAFAIDLVQRPTAPVGAGEQVDRAVRVAVDAPDLCPRYTARIVRGVRVGPSPAWVIDRLRACGLRSVNNVVDVSNLVLLELGQPIHTFDLGLLRDATILVRRANEGEALTTLDGIERRLDPGMLVIADPRHPVAVAGIMGGAETEIRESTTDVLIEAALFAPSSIRATARRLRTKTDASHRFERGVDPDGLPEAQSMAVRLLAEIAGGVPAAGIIDVDSRQAADRVVHLRLPRVRVLLGFDPGEDRVRSALNALGLDTPTGTEDGIPVIIPSWRGDLKREADLIEEIARHIGYDHIPATLPAALGAPGIRGAENQIQERCRDQLSALGFSEALNYAMVPAGQDDPFVASPIPGVVELNNPLSEQLAVMRRSLLAGLLLAAGHNVRRGQSDVRLFEVGRVFHRGPGDGLPSEPLHGAVVWTGSGAPRHWAGEFRPASFNDLVGLVESVLEGLRPGRSWERGTESLPGFDPVRSATWSTPDGAIVARGGELRPGLSDHRHLQDGVLVAELDLSALLAVAVVEPRHRPLPRVPAVARDLSLVLSDSMDFHRVLAVLEGVPAPTPVDFDVTARYTGEGLGPDEASVTVRVMLRPFDKSLTDPEIEAYRTALVRALEEQLGVRLRS